MKRIVTLFLIAVLSSSTLTGCFGSFHLTKRLYAWNSSVGDKWTNSAILWAFMIIPVYEVAGIIDFAFINVLEFWSGTNPVDMSANAVEEQEIVVDGKTYVVTTRQNRMDITALDVQDEPATASLIYQPDTQSWYLSSKNGKMNIAQVDPFNPDQMLLFGPDGSMLTFDTVNQALSFE